MPTVRHPAPSFQTLFLPRHHASPPLLALLHLSPTPCFRPPFSRLPLLSFSFSVPLFSLPCLLVSSIFPRDGHLCCLWWFRQTARIVSELPKAGACSPLIPLPQVPAMDQLGIQSLKRSLHNANSPCTLTGEGQLRSSVTREPWIMDEVKLEVEDTETLQLSSKQKYL